jgi:hypothetical protein
MNYNYDDGEKNIKRIKLKVIKIYYNLKKSNF